MRCRSRSSCRSGRWRSVVQGRAKAGKRRARPLLRAFNNEVGTLRFAHPRQQTARSGQRHNNICPGKVGSFKEEWLGTRFRQSVDRAINDVELRRMSSTLTETLKRLESAFRHIVVERHDDNPGSRQQLVKKRDGRRSETSGENDLGFQYGYCRHRQAISIQHGCPIALPIWLVGYGRDNRRGIEHHQDGSPKRS